MTEQEAELNAIREITGFLLIDDKKRYLTRLGLVMTFFFKNGYTPEKKAAILRCYRRFRELYAGKLRFHTHNQKGMKKYSEENIEKLEQYIQTSGSAIQAVNHGAGIDHQLPCLLFPPL